MFAVAIRCRVVALHEPQSLPEDPDGFVPVFRGDTCPRPVRYLVQLTIDILKGFKRDSSPRTFLFGHLRHAPAVQRKGLPCLK